MVEDWRSGSRQQIGDLRASLLEPQSVPQLMEGTVLSWKLGKNSIGLIVLKEDGFDLCGLRLHPPSPHDGEEGGLPRVLFVSGAAVCLIRRRHPCLFLLLSIIPFKLGSWRGLIYFVLFLTSLSLFRM